MEALITAIWYKRLPSLIQLEAIWPLEHLKEGEYNVLAKACAGTSKWFTSLQERKAVGVTPERAEFVIGSLFALQSGTSR